METTLLDNLTFVLVGTTEKRCTSVKDGDIIGITLLDMYPGAGYLNINYLGSHCSSLAK
jgi:hypothetical protein